MQILIVCSSCKTSYNVVSHSHWGLGQFVESQFVEFVGESVGGSEKKRVIPDFRSPEVGISAVLCVLLGEDVHLNESQVKR